MGPKSYQKVVQQIIKKVSKAMQILGPKMDPKMGQDGDPGAQWFLDGGS